jgi:RimJ/RimL family protein N-acetyltransferase
MSDGGISVNRTWIAKPVIDIVREVWEFITDDSKKPEDKNKYIPRLCDESRWYISSENGEQVGAFWMRKVNHITWEAHANVRPKFWGDKRGTEHCRVAIAEMIRETGAKKVVAQIPTSCKPVMEMAEEIGFVREGASPNAWQKNGQLYDIVHYGITRT